MEKQQSPSWDKYEPNPGDQGFKNFPYNEGFPKMYSGKQYDLILRSGEKCIARVDDSREFMSEGLEWKILKSDEGIRGNVERAVVIAWKEI